MRQYRVIVNDLYALTFPRLNEIQMPQDVHFNEKGSEILGEHVAAFIWGGLESREKP